LSISEKLADYDQTVDLLSRLSKEELEELAKRNGVKLEWEDLSGKVRKARTKSQIIEVLLESEFRESDLIELLGTSRLTKEELLNCMNVRQLKRLAKETGIELVKPTIFGTKKATKKKDIIDVLSVLSTSKIREFAEKIKLIRKTAGFVKRKKPKSAKAKARMLSKRKKAIKLAHKEKKEVKPIEYAKEKPLKEAPMEEYRLKPELLTEEAVRQGGIIEEVTKEIITERHTVRRILFLRTLEREINEALRNFSPSAEMKEREYERQLYDQFMKKPLISEVKRGKFDFVLGKDQIAVELKAARGFKALDRLTDKISRYLDEYEKIFVVIVDKSSSPEKIEEKAKEIEKIDPKKIRVVIKRAKKKK